MATFISSFWVMFFGWMPPLLQIAFGCFLALALIILVIKVIALILDAIPIL